MENRLGPLGINVLPRRQRGALSMIPTPQGVEKICAQAGKGGQQNLDHAINSHSFILPSRETRPTNPAQDKGPDSRALHAQENRYSFLAKPCLFRRKLYFCHFFKNTSSSWTWFQLLCFRPAFLHKLLSGSPHDLPLLVTSTPPPVVANPSRSSPKATTKLGEQLGWRSLRVKAVKDKQLGVVARLSLHSSLSQTFLLGPKELPVRLRTWCGILISRAIKYAQCCMVGSLPALKTDFE